MTGRVRVSSYAVSPVLLGAGEPLWNGLDLSAAGYGIARTQPGEKATHLLLSRKAIV